MAKKKRVNPHRRPVTMATVNRVKEETKDEAVSLAIEYIALAEAVANMVNVIQPVVVRVARAICAASAAFMAEMREVQR